MVRPAHGMLALALYACAHARLPGAAGPIVCPPGTAPDFQTDSDVGWGEVEQRNACAKPDGTLEGPAIELVDGRRGGATKLVGSYAGGVRVGTWSQYVEGTGTKLGGFTLDAAGSGTELVRDAVGHYCRGAVVHGRREGSWTYHDTDGKLVATRVWSRGQLVREMGRPGWDPPMIDPRDMCPTDGGARTADGCRDDR
jgi:hypothetical protein